MTKRGIIYKVISPSGRIYIGKTIKTLQERKNQHHASSRNKNYIRYNYKIARAIRKYGDSLKWSILYKDVLITDLNKLEIKEIKKHDSFNSGYNSTMGGDGTTGRIHSKKTKKKIANSLMGRHRSDSTKKKLSKAHTGKKLSKEHKESISNSLFAKYKTKLNMKIANKIRKEYASGKYTQGALGKKHKLSSKIISGIVRKLR